MEPILATKTQKIIFAKKMSESHLLRVIMMIIGKIYIHPENMTPWVE